MNHSPIPHHLDSMEGLPNPLDAMAAEQTPARIREFIETMTRQYKLQGFELTYTDALGHVTYCDWDGQTPPVFTPLSTINA